MNNLCDYHPYNTHYFTFDNLQIPWVPFPIHLANSFTLAQRSVSQLHHKNISYTIPIHSNSEEIIHSLLQPLYSDNPLLHFDKAPKYCSLTLLDQYQNTKIRTNSIMVSPSDKEEFAIQIKELLNLNLIRPSHSQHSSPAFLVRNHTELKRGKARMVINYRKLNSCTKFDGYFIPAADHLIKQIQESRYYSKFDVKSGFWQIKLANVESIELIAFSCPQGHYEWLVMPFGLKMLLKYIKSE